MFLPNLPTFIFSLLVLFALNACVSADYSKINNYKTSLKVSNSNLNTKTQDSNFVYIYLVKVKENEIVLETIKRELSDSSSSRISTTLVIFFLLFLFYCAFRKL